MPRRTREHELSETSERVFGDTLGETLKFHPRPQFEYGIDGDVEHFASDGEASGLHFFVQLKATDEDHLGKALAVSVELETANYYRRAPIPVLMVRYHAPTGALYGRWFHQYDPYYGRGGTKTLTFRWQSGDRFDVATPQRLAAEAAAFYEMRKAAIRLPLDLYVSCVSAFGFGPAEMRIALRELVRERADIFTVRAEPPAPGSVHLEVRADTLVAHLGSVTAATMYLPAETAAGDYDAHSMALEAMVLLALAFERVGQDGIAARLAASYLPPSVMATDPDVAFALSACMGRSHRVAEALKLAEEFDVPDDRERATAGFVFGLAALMTSDTLSERTPASTRPCSRAASSAAWPNIRARPASRR